MVLLFVAHNRARADKTSIRRGKSRTLGCEKMSKQNQQWLRERIAVSSFKGIDKFYDISLLLAEANGLQETVDRLCEICRNFEFDLIASPEARGFVLGGTVAFNLMKGLVMLRKSGKLPNAAASVCYGTEYSTDHLEIGAETVKPGQKVLILDDLVATGGTPLAAAELVKALGGEVVGVVSLIELEGMGARELLEQHGYLLFSVLKYDAEPLTTAVAAPTVTKA